MSQSPDGGGAVRVIAGLVSKLAGRRGVTLNASTTLLRQRREEFQDVCSRSDAPTSNGCHITKEEKVRSRFSLHLGFSKS